MCNVEAFFLSGACFFFAKKIDQGGTLLAPLVFVLYLFLRLPSILVALALIFLWAGANAIAHVFMQALQVRLVVILNHFWVLHTDAWFP